MNKLITITVIFLWLLISASSSFAYTQIYEVDKCNFIAGNSYYEANQDCYNVLEKPLLEFGIGLFVFGFLYLLIGMLIFIFMEGLE